jgi:hypothetical protein
MHHAPARSQRLAHVSQPGHGIGEEHCAEAREYEVVLIGWKRDLGIAPYEADVAPPARFAPRIIEKGIAAVDTDHLAFRSHQVG